MHIRKTTLTDTPFITELILLATEEILYEFIGERNHEKTNAFLFELAQETGTQYSYENCWVMELNNEIVATALVYDGAHLSDLRQPVAAKIKQQFSKNFSPENETEAGEIYIDSVGVSIAHQGKGFGKQLLQFLINEYVIIQNQTLGLLVEPENERAKNMYLKLGFEQVGIKTLVGKTLYHLQASPKYF